MRLRFAVSLFLACALAAGLSAADLTPEQWREDVSFLARELPARHKNLFFHLSKADFERQIEHLQEAAATAGDIEMRAGLTQLLASVGDLHTGIQSFDPSKSLGLGFYELPEGIYCVSAREELADAVGARVIAVQGIPVSKVVENLRQFVPHENDMVVLALASPLLSRPTALAAAHVPVPADAADFEMERAGLTFVIHATVSANNPATIRRVPPGVDATPLFQQDRVSKYWFRYLDSGTLYIQYNSCAPDPARPFPDFAGQIAQTIAGRRPRRIVVDLRFNGGGDSRIIGPLLSVLKKPAGAKIYAIIGRNTMSSAFMAARDLKYQDHATLVGEPTGQKPNSYGELGHLTLPNSKLVVNYSTKYFRLAEHGDPPSYLPDHFLPMTSAAIAQGRDPVMEWIEKQ